MTQKLTIDPDAVRVLADILKETGLTEVEYQVDSLRIKVVKSVSQAVLSNKSNFDNTGVGVVNVSNNNSPESNNKFGSDSFENHPGIVEAQMVGTVYLSPGPDANPFISVGDTVSQGQTLFIIEAMKVMNMIKAHKSGVVKHIFVKDGQPVEYGDPIIIVE